MPKLVLGPILRYVGSDEAMIWVETDTACTVDILGFQTRTFAVFGHHYALVHIDNLPPGSATEYSVILDGDRVWPEPDSNFPCSVIRTASPDNRFRLMFGSCRICVPHEPPYTLRKEQDERGREVDALYALALRMCEAPHPSWPDALLLLGDQIYADHVSEGTLDYIRSQRSTDEPPGEQVANFEEYTRLYWDAWGEPAIRWLLSTVPSVMIFDDHDVLDDWNISESWVMEMRDLPWWNDRITGGFMSYWIYQHLGNLSPQELKKEALFQQVRHAQDAGEVLRNFAWQADRDADSYRWSVYRDFGNIRLVVMDSRAGRVLKDGRRRMIDAQEWQWIERHVHGDFDHLLLATSLPFVMSPGIHYLEAWNEAVCAGAWGKLFTGIGERLRRAVDLEHWSAFQYSFSQFAGMLRAVAGGQYGTPPAAITVLSGDVHHAYLAEIDLTDDTDIDSRIYQAVCSPMRNSLARHERRIMRFAWTRFGTMIGKLLAWSTGVREHGVDWHLMHTEPWFNNQIATLEIHGRVAEFIIEKTNPEEADKAQLEAVFRHQLS